MFREIVFRFQVDDVIEAKDGRVWRMGRVSKQEPYRGREGYYIHWLLAPDAPSWASRGGWHQGSCVRSLEAGRLAREAWIREHDKATEERLRDEGVIGGRYDDNEERTA